MKQPSTREKGSRREMHEDTGGSGGAMRSQRTGLDWPAHRSGPTP